MGHGPGFACMRCSKNSTIKRTNCTILVVIPCHHTLLIFSGSFFNLWELETDIKRGDQTFVIQYPEFHGEDSAGKITTSVPEDICRSVGPCIR